MSLVLAPAETRAKKRKTKSERGLTTPISTIRAWLNYRLPLSLISHTDVDTNTHTHMSSTRNFWTDRHTHGWTHGRMDGRTRQEVSDIHTQLIH